MTFLVENDGNDVLYELRGLDFDLLFDFEPNVERESDLSKAAFETFERLWREYERECPAGTECHHGDVFK